MSESNRVAGIDFSKKKIGFAVTDENCKFIAYKCLIQRDFKKKIQDLYDKYKPKKTFIGLAYSGDGTLASNGKTTKVWAHGMRYIIKNFEFLCENRTTRLVNTIRPGENSDTNVACFLIKLGLMKLNNN